MNVICPNTRCREHQIPKLVPPEIPPTMPIICGECGTATVPEEAPPDG